MREAQVVRTPLVTITSLTATGTPASAPSGSPAASWPSTRRAGASAGSRQKCRKTAYWSFSASASRRAASASSTALTRRSVRPPQAGIGDAGGFILAAAGGGARAARGPGRGQHAHPELDILHDGFIGRRVQLFDDLPGHAGELPAPILGGGLHYQG